VLSGRRMMKVVQAYAAGAGGFLTPA